MSDDLLVLGMENSLSDPGEFQERTDKLFNIWKEEKIT